MSLHEYTASGLTTLTPAAVQSLEVWFTRYRAQLIDSVNRSSEQRAAPAAPAAQNAAMPAAAASGVAAARTPLPPANAHTVTAIRVGSRYIQIDDGSVWDVFPADQAETATWQLGDFVQVRSASGSYGEFDHELVNNQRTGPVRAKFIGYATK